jgi:hypothetical protein
MQRAGQPVYLANQKTPLGYNQENIYVVWFFIMQFAVNMYFKKIV